MVRLKPSAPKTCYIKFWSPVSKHRDFGADSVYQSRVNRGDEELGGFVPFDDCFAPGVNDAGVAEELGVFGVAYPVAGDDEHLIFDGAAA